MSAMSQAEVAKAIKQITASTLATRKTMQGQAQELGADDAIAGEDANWGRVVMAVGKAGEPAERDLLAIRFGATQVAEKGLPVEGYDEAPVAAHLKGQDITIGVDIGLSTGRATVWTCDLTHGYISINADYRS